MSSYDLHFARKPSPPRAASTFRVLLVNMPWVAVTRPAIGVSLLKSILREQGVEARVAYGNLLFAARVGLDAYELVNDRMITGLFSGDWLFAQHLFADAVDPQGYAAKLRQFADSAEAYDTVMEMRAAVPPFLDECMDAFDVEHYDMIGFTTTFEQNLASLSLARMVKERYPEKVVVFGGANCDGVMGAELHRSFPWIDYVVAGEADLVFPRLVRHLASGGAVPPLPGVIARVNGDSVPGPGAEPVQDLNASPIPEYDDYFEALAATPFGGDFQPMMPFESARGCWWGAKNHCTFCGLNAENMSFRAKSAARVLTELETQKQRYPSSHRYMAVDNILPYEYFKTLLPELKQRNLGVTLFYEIKANLRRDQVELLRDAGVVALQPGIENLSTPVLRLMRKGTTGLQNVQMLKLAREYGIHVVWNLLYGFPGEQAEHYAETPRMLDAISHLAPPTSVSPIRLDRFSPNFDKAAEFGFVNVRPFSTYSHLYPLPPERVANLAYFFRYEYGDGRRSEAYMAETMKRVEMWKRHKSGALTMEWDEDELILVDTRLGRSERRIRLSGLERELFELCADARSRAALVAHARAYGPRGGGATLPPDAIEMWLDEFLARMTADLLMLREGDQYLSLAVNPTLDRRAHRAAMAAVLAALA